MKKDGFNISESPAPFKRPETPPPAPPAAGPDEDLICPVCEGSGEGWTMSDSSPDAHMIQVDCGECSGSGSLHGAYQTVKTQRDYLATRVSDAGGQALFMRSEIEKLKADNESLRGLVLSALEEGNGRPGTGGNAPGHCHAVPGVWDRGNGERSGTACGWCRIWNAAQAMAKERGQ